jgi:hypothetical protein
MWGVLSPPSRSVEPEDVNGLLLFTSEHGVAAQKAWISWVTSLAEKASKLHRVVMLVIFNEEVTFIQSSHIMVKFIRI